MPKPFVVVESENFRMEAQSDGDHLTLRPVGYINEDVNFGKTLQLITEMGVALRQVSFDMGHVSEINSCGVREWLLFVERVQALTKCKFTMVNELFIEQASIVPNMLGKPGTLVDKFSAPFYCATCDRRSLRLLETKDVALKSGKYAAPEFRCEKCTNELEFDALEDEYFTFLNYSKK